MSYMKHGPPFKGNSSSSVNARGGGGGSSFLNEAADKTMESLPKYQFGDLIGQGAFGKVFRALNTETGDFCAIKQIEKAILSPQQVPGIMRECELLQTLEHPNIVTFIESLETEEHLFFIMEYIEGGSLHKATKKFGVFPEGLLARYVAHVLKGLQYLHSQGVIHRDIKGENILITKQGIVKLVDFGSCTYQAMDKMLTVVGTPFWMAPEIIEMDSSSRHTACDIWSLGCTIIELVTGNPPYWERGPMPAMFAMVNEPHPPLPASISEELKEFLLACFTRDIPKRPSAAQLLEHPWITMFVRADRGSFSVPEELSGSAGIKKDEEPHLVIKLQQLEKENENLNSTVRSLKTHLLKLMKEKKQMKTQLDSLEEEVTTLRQALGGSHAKNALNGGIISVSRMLSSQSSMSDDNIGLATTEKQHVPLSKTPRSAENIATVATKTTNASAPPPQPTVHEEPDPVASETAASDIRPGDKCKVRECPNSGSWHRATVESVTSRGTIIIVWKSSGRREEVPSSHVKLDEKEKPKQRKGSSGKESGKEGKSGSATFGNKKHVASIFSFKHH